jgi:hypothetical protein
VVVRSGAPGPPVTPLVGGLLVMRKVERLDMLRRPRAMVLRSAGVLRELGIVYSRIKEDSFPGFA